MGDRLLSRDSAKAFEHLCLALDQGIIQENYVAKVGLRGEIPVVHASHLIRVSDSSHDFGTAIVSRLRLCSYSDQKRKLMPLITEI